MLQTEDATIRKSYSDITCKTYGQATEPDGQTTDSLPLCQSPEYLYPGARVQQQVAEKMMQLIKEPYTRFHRVVEFGCGTGSYSRILLHTLQPETLLLNDLCREMEECVKELCDGTTVQFVPGDAGASTSPEKPT